MIAVGAWRAEEVRHGGRLLVPLFRTVTVRPPGVPAGLVWSRPLAIEVRGSGAPRFLPVTDWTRRVQWILLGAGAAAGIFLRLAARRDRRRRGGRP